MKSSILLLISLMLFNLPALTQTKMIITKYDGNADSINLEDIKSISFGNNQNLIKNGEFNFALENWLTIGQGNNPYHPEDPGRAGFNIEGGILEIDISNQGISIWSIMLYQRVIFRKGVTYSISFDAKSDSPVEILSNVCQEGGNWTNYSGDFKFELTETMSNYSYEFTMNTEGMALFQFCLGTLGTRKIFLDNIVLKEK